jgi:endo-1,4-beta-xylanase
MRKFLLSGCVLYIFVFLMVCFFLPACTTSKQKEGQNMEEQNNDEKKLTAYRTFSGNSRGNQPLPGTPYGYEVWSAGGNNNKLIWYGPKQGGGAAFRAEWNNSNDFLGRVGYFWNQGRPYAYYKNIFCEFDFTRSANGTAGSYSYIGIYGWSRNPMIEWYIVDDWYGFGIMGPSSMGGGAAKKGEFTADGAVYFIYQALRPAGSANIEGSNAPFAQFFSIRQTRRQSGTISITEHFKEWERIGMNLGANMYEAKFLVEAGGGTGWFDASYISFYQKD